MQKKKLSITQTKLFQWGLIPLVLCWGIYFIVFYKVYKEIMFYVDTSSTFVLQMIWIIEYNGREIAVLTVTAAILLLLTELYTWKIFQERTESAAAKKIGYAASVVFLLAVIGLLSNHFGLFFLLAVLGSSLVSYFIIVFRASGKTEEQYEDDDIVETEGPFPTEAAALAYFEKYRRRQAEFFHSRKLVLASEVDQEDDGYYIEIYVESTEKITADDQLKEAAPQRIKNN